MKAYSLDLRQKTYAHNNHEGSPTTSQRFSVSLSFVQTLLRRYQETGGVIYHTVEENS